MAAVRVDCAKLDSYGFVHDRRFAVTSRDGKLLTQRECRRLAALQPQISDDGFLRLSDIEHPEIGTARVPLQAASAEDALLEVYPSPTAEWGGFTPLCLDCGDEVASWLTTAIDWPQMNDFPKYRLVKMAGDGTESYESSPRRVRMASSQHWAEAYTDDSKLAFQDSSPILIASMASLAELNRRLQKDEKEPVPIHRFRPNLVIEAEDAFAEDWWSKLRLQGPRLRGGLPLQVAKPCQRCVVTTKPQAEGRSSDNALPASPSSMLAEPLRTLKKFRLLRKGQDKKFGTSPCFGVNAAMIDPRKADGAEICVGNTLLVESWARESLLTTENLWAVLR